MTGTILTTTVLLIIFYISCELIETRTRLVNECPKNENETTQASESLKCEKDEYNNSQYLCLPHVNKTSLVEFCYNGTLGIREKGNCLETDEGKIKLHSCSNFSDGCPDKPFFDYDFYKYPACQNISTEFHCYLLDPICSTQTTTEETTTRAENDVISIILGVASSIVFILVLCICIICLVKRKFWPTKDDKFLDNVGEDHIEQLPKKSPASTNSEKGIKTVVKMDKDKEITIRHIRGIIVGCGGAGKTTLLERLKGTSYQDLQKIESTVIADVHPNCFEVLEEDQNIKYVGSDKTKPAILLHEGMLHEKRSIKTDLLETANTRKDESGTDSRERKELTGRMPNIETKNHPDQRRENDHHDIEKTPLLPDWENILPEERAHLPMQSKNEKIRNEIETNKDENYSEILNAITEELNNELSGRKHLPTQITFLDFAGQSMYYAFHQIFLSPKTFYILVVDMTKKLDDEVKETLNKGDKSPGKHEELCSRFQSWKYKDYYKFWLESINRFSDKKTPVIIVGTHAEKLSETECDKIFDDLYALFDNHHHLQNHLNTRRRYAIGIPKGVLKLDELKEIKECIAEIAQCPIYSEHSIRFSWAVFERFLQQEKIKNNKKIISRKDLLYHNSQFKEYEEEDDEISKLLECLYMAGTLLYFDEEKLKDTIILDLEWFVDAFKCIIKYEVPIDETTRERDDFKKTGELLDKELVKIWEKASNDCFLKYKEDITKYMERLDLLAQYGSDKSRWYYVPSMNKKKFDMNTEGFSKSSIFCFDFSEQEHNPIFLFYRLSLKCSKLPGWTFQKHEKKKSIYENVVCLYYRDHTVVICVCNLQIQVQVCHKKTEVDRKLLPGIQKSMEQIMGTYHKYCYRVGYKCQKGKLNNEADNSFVDIKSFPVSEEDYCRKCTFEDVHSIDNNICWVQIKDRQNEDVKNEDEKAQAGYQPDDRDGDVKNEDEKAQAGYQPDDRDGDVKNEDEKAQAGNGDEDEDYKNTNELIDATMDWEEKAGRQATPSNPEFREPESPCNGTRPLFIGSGENQNNSNYTFKSALAKVFSIDTANEVRIVLLGKTGAGKSATGNSILGRKVFESMASASSITSRCGLKSAFRFGYNIFIVDTPGIFDTSLPNKNTQEEIRKCIAITSPGPHAFILVLSISRFTEEEQKSVEHFVKHFGESVYRYVIVLFTRKDDLDDTDQSLQDFIKTSPESLKLIIKRCSGRVIAFNNKLTGEKNHEQASKLIDMILKNIEENGGIFYTNELYEDAEKRLKQREKEIIIETEEEREKELIATQKFYQVQDIDNAFSAKLEKLKEERDNGILSIAQFEKKRKEAQDMLYFQFLSLHEEENKIVQEKYEKKSKSTRNELRNNIM